MWYFMRFPEGKKKALTLSYDDGVRQDKRLMKILDQHGLKCTFNINTGLFDPLDHYDKEEGRMSEKEALALYQNSGHEVAVHAYTHPYLEQLPVHLATAEVLRDRHNIERLFGTITRGMAYPFGTYSDQVVDCLRTAGIVYSRTVRSTGEFYIPTDWLRLPATCHHKDPRLPGLTERFVTEAPERAPWLFYLWGHSYEFDNDDNWAVIENFADRTGNREDIWYAVNIDVYDYIQDFSRLRFDCAMTTAHNPTARTLWFELDGAVCSIEPGETLCLKETRN